MNAPKFDKKQKPLCCWSLHTDG